MDFRKIIFIVGPTAVGKSDVACRIASCIPCEIISCDSMQIYREITIANNKPGPQTLREFPHHLVDILSITEEFDVARFDELAQAAIRDVQSRGKVPLVVGGSGMYMQVLLDGIFKGGIKNENLRKDLKEQARQHGNQYIYDKLIAVDPVAAGKIHPNDVRRVVRALEIAMTEQVPISEMQKNRQGLWGHFDISLFALNRERAELYRRIDARVDEMFRQGLVDEIGALKNMAWSLTAGKIIGVPEVQKILRSECTVDEAKEAMALNTRRLAKRQLTWFRKDKRLEWIDIAPGVETALAAERIMHIYQSAIGATGR